MVPQDSMAGECVVQASSTEVGPSDSLPGPGVVTCESVVAGHDSEEPSVRRRGLATMSRKLTVDTKPHKLIGDLIEKSEESAPGSCTSKKHPAAAVQTPGMVLSVWGSETTDTDTFAPYFSQKPINFNGDVTRMPHRIGIMSHRGHKPESPNQDEFFLLARPESLLFGVMDGHGSEGHTIAHFAQERLPTKITEHLRRDGEDWEGAVRHSVKELCKNVREEYPAKAEHSGCTVTVAILDKPGYAEEGGSSCSRLRLRVAHLGDSIAIAAKRRVRGDPWEVTQLTDIHRPDRPDEEERIIRTGGTVRPGEGNCPSRLMTPQGNLAMSRSFGDFHAAAYGLSCEPEFAATIDLEDGWEHLVMVCSDGVWDVMPPAQAATFVGKFRPEEAQLAAERLVHKAQLRWQETEDVVDDITAIIIWPSFGDMEEES